MDHFLRLDMHQTKQQNTFHSNKVYVTFPLNVCSSVWTKHFAMHTQNWKWKVKRILETVKQVKNVADKEAILEWVKLLTWTTEMSAK